MVIATFGPTTGWTGKTITFDNEIFTLEGFGPIAPGDVMQYDAQGHLIWPSEEMRAWCAVRAGVPLAPVAPAEAPVIPAGAQSVAAPAVEASPEVADAPQEDPVVVAQTAVQEGPAVAPPAGAQASADVVMAIAKLAELHDMGAVTDEEFATLKARLIDQA